MVDIVSCGLIEGLLMVTTSIRSNTTTERKKWQEEFWKNIISLRQRKGRKRDRVFLFLLCFENYLYLEGNKPNYIGNSSSETWLT